MKWYKNLYLSDSVVSKKSKVLHKLKRNKLQINVFVIVLPLEEMGIMEIYPSYVLLQKIYEKRDIKVIGIASDVTESYELAGEIAMDCFNARKDFDIEAFMNEYRRELHND